MRLPERITRRRACLLLILGVILGSVSGWRPLWATLESSFALAPSPKASVIGARAVDPGDILRATAVTRLDSVARLDVDEIIDRVLEHPWIEEARGIALPPDRLVLGVVERQPVARIAVGRRLWWVDRRGLAFAPVRGGEHTAPLILGVADPAPERSHRFLDLAVRVCEAVDRRESLPPLRAVRVGGTPKQEIPRIEFENGVQVVIGPGGLREKLERLEALFRELPPEQLLGSEIDLRFGDRMVLRNSATRETGAR
jgi:cell division septal protein FtsQ